jgi:hypothetical protein
VRNASPTVRPQDISAIFQLGPNPALEFGKAIKLELPVAKRALGRLFGALLKSAKYEPFRNQITELGPDVALSFFLLPVFMAGSLRQLQVPLPLFARRFEVSERLPQCKLKGSLSSASLRADTGNIDLLCVQPKSSFFSHSGFEAFETCGIDRAICEDDRH